MFIGHFAVALGAKKAVPTMKLGTLILAAQFLDLLWPFFLLVGLEHVRIVPNASPFTRLVLYDYPISHSLFMALFWSFFLGGFFYLKNKQKNGAIVLGLAVFSHWILDFLTHTPDLPLLPTLNVYVGLGLWNSTIGTVILESAIFFIGILFYFQITKARDAIGHYAPWTLILFLLISYIASIYSAPPPDASPIEIIGLVQWLFIPWGYWIDRHRMNR